eukprot:10792687-Prorocentrum_lima.AAC.1
MPRWLCSICPSSLRLDSTLAGGCCASADTHRIPYLDQSSPRFEASEFVVLAIPDYIFALSVRELRQQR